MSRKPIQFENHPVSFEHARDYGMLRCTIGHVVDGDTWDLFIDMGFGDYGYKPMRLVGEDPKVLFDVYEKNTPKGKQALEFVQESVVPLSLLVKSYRDTQTFERWLGQVFYVSGPDLSIKNVVGILRAGGFEKPKETK